MVPEATDGGLEPDELEKNSEPKSEDVRRSCSEMYDRGSVGGKADKKSSGCVVVRGDDPPDSVLVCSSKSDCFTFHLARFSRACDANCFISKRSSSVSGMNTLN